MPAVLGFAFELFLHSVPVPVVWKPYYILLIALVYFANNSYRKINEKDRKLIGSVLLPFELNNVYAG